MGGVFQQAGALTVNNIARWGTITGINELYQNHAINIYPNPSTGIFNFEITSSQQPIAKSHLEVYNMLGKMVYNETLRQAQGDNTVDLSSQPAGIYLYRIVSEQGTAIATGKLVIE